MATRTCSFHNVSFSAVREIGVSGAWSHSSVAGLWSWAYRAKPGVPQRARPPWQAGRCLVRRLRLSDEEATALTSGCTEVLVKGDI